MAAIFDRRALDTDEAAAVFRQALARATAAKDDKYEAISHHQLRAGGFAAAEREPTRVAPGRLVPRCATRGPTRA
jgi:hypothetical protein